MNINQDTQRIAPPDPSAPVALVTGAARGIGMAIATHFLQNGYRVALLDWRCTPMWANPKRSTLPCSRSPTNGGDWTHW
jgi:nucleoside-diphosphate-sugar epimerase